MATTSGFKQQCPSCEAMVPIRDPGLVGRKIDCPKCKYRFVVEKPKARGDEDDSSDTPFCTRLAIVGHDGREPHIIHERLEHTGFVEAARFGCQLVTGPNVAMILVLRMV